VHCSAECRRAAALDASLARKWNARPTQCPECGGQITQPPIGRPRRFCSDDCKRRASNRKIRRSAKPQRDVIDKVCPTCGEVFTPRNRNRIYCYNRSCKDSAYRKRRKTGDHVGFAPHEVVCDNCGVTFTAVHPRARWCSKQCCNQHWGRLRMRRRTAPAMGNYLDREVFERDGWICHICGTPVRTDVDRLHPEGATIDHIVPISAGGHDVETNVATAHWRCNREKGTSTI
jgi:ribosomal protein L32